MTVSRVLNDRPDVSSATRKRIQQLIDELGYAPNAMASSLRQGRSNTLGVVASGIEYFGPSRTLVGVEQEAEALGYSLLLNLLHYPESNHGEELLDSMLSRQVEGIVWAVPEIGSNREWITEKVRGIATPVIFLSMQPRERSMVSAVDNYAGGRLATEHLLSQGSKQVGIINGPPTWWEARQRTLGWKDALTDAGIEAQDAMSIDGDWTAASGETGLAELLEQWPSLDAVFASND